MLGASLVGFGPTSALQVTPQASLGFRNEPGVETKEFLSAGATAAVPFGGFWGGIALSAGDNPGIAGYGIGAEARLLGLRLRG